MFSCPTMNVKRRRNPKHTNQRSIFPVSVKQRQFIYVCRLSRSDLGHLPSSPFIRLLNGGERKCPAFERRTRGEKATDLYNLCLRAFYRNRCSHCVHLYCRGRKRMIMYLYRVSSGPQ